MRQYSTVQVQFCYILMFWSQIGTYQMAVCSKAHNKPFYVVAESFKFVRLYPLNQQDVPDRFKVGCLVQLSQKLSAVDTFP